MGFHHVGQAGLKLLTSGDPSASASQSAEITRVSHRTWPDTSSLAVKSLISLTLLYVLLCVHIFRSEQPRTVGIIFWALGEKGQYFLFFFF